MDSIHHSPICSFRANYGPCNNVWHLNMAGGETPVKRHDTIIELLDIDQTKATRRERSLTQRRPNICLAWAAVLSQLHPPCTHSFQTQFGGCFALACIQLRSFHGTFPIQCIGSPLGVVCFPINMAEQLESQPRARETRVPIPSWP